MSKKLLIGFGLLALLILWSIVSIYPDWLWFENLSFSPVFWTMLVSKFGFGLLVWLLLIIVIFVNLYAARRINSGKTDTVTFGDEGGYFSQLGLSGRALNLLMAALVLILSLIIASRGSGQWDVVLRYLYQQPFESTDPIFNKDIGFYLFSLPLYIMVRKGLLLFFVIAGLITIVWYLKDGAVQIIEELARAEDKPVSIPKIVISPKAKKHLVFLGGIIVLLLAWGYYLKIYGLIYSTQGPAFGASYTDVHVKIWAYRALILVSIGFAVVLFSSVANYRAKLVWVSGGVWLAAIIIFATIAPLLVQKLVVKPNELAKESPYIAYNINYTRQAYNLNKIKELDFPVGDTLTREDIINNDVTIQNIRIWDERPLLQTYKQIQAIRLYYNFENMDVDRYIINNQYRQVMLAARELVVNQLPPQANTWVNRHLIYTHGYGLASSPVNEVTSEGLPRLFIKDLPPSFVPGLDVVRPEIYFGEKTEEYVLVKTKAEEFDYPKGDKNVYATYTGKGGVHINSFARRLLFAIEFFDPQILFTTYLSPQSRIMYNRRIQTRVRVLAPFLDYDDDPYLVVSKGKLYWIQDAYTTSDMYPYSTPSPRSLYKMGINYIRNSVKVTIDAYTGEVSFYLIDEQDPIAKTYSKIFPDLFKPFKEMPPDLRRHIRYPKDLFNIQVGTYRTYHMEDVQVFYNQEDLWQIPDELYGNTRQAMEPYYIIMKLPEEKKEEFLLMLPFTPSKKDNMIGWLAARSDLPNYGDLLIYKLPKEKLVFGPMQVEARVDQQTEISRELSLWGQKGSRVIRGNLLAIPLGELFIYVEPIYLRAAQDRGESAPAQPSQPRGFGRPKMTGAAGSPELDKLEAAALPELKRVIVAFGNRLVMEENLEKALNSLLEGERVPKKLATPAIPGSQNIYGLSKLALEHFDKAKGYLREGNWSEYGRELEQLEKALREMSGITK